MVSIYPSLISANLLNLEREIRALEPYCDGFHIDIMDNHFVPNLTWGLMFVDAINKITNKPLWVHLMVDRPENFIDSIFLNANSTLTFHIESNLNIKDACVRIQDKNIVPSIAISPKTAVEKIFPFLDIADHILIMTVDPGFSGQDFLQSSESKIEKLFSYCQHNGLKVNIAVDGGVRVENIGDLAGKGVNIFAVGSGIFGYENRVEAIKNLYEFAKK